MPRSPTTVPGVCWRRFMLGRRSVPPASGAASVPRSARMAAASASERRAGTGMSIALGTATATRDGKTLSYRTAEIFHIRDGRAVERWAFSDDTAAIVAFFA